MKKELLAGGIIRDLLFQSPEDMETYLDKLEDRKQQYKVVETYERQDRSVIIRIISQYNNAPLIRVFD